MSQKMIERIKCNKTLKPARTYINYVLLCFRSGTLPIGVRRLGDCCLKFTKNSIGPIYLHLVIFFFTFERKDPDGK
jgi:hypothetical protein